ncbi:MAG UNVERIFIED_CONTAM: hypothetical protein LVR29_22485 [Microcystis novacekii LVE1205-3]|jgi:hypothetical protein
MATTITDSAEADKHHKKQIANTVYGLLEMHVNRNSKSFIFRQLQQCQVLSGQIRGLSIHQIRQYQEQRDQYINPLDDGIEGIEPTERVDFVETGQDDVRAQHLCAGRHDKWLPLHQRIASAVLQPPHAGGLTQAQRRLASRPDTVKTDAFTVREQDLAKAVEVLGVEMEGEEKEIGGLEVEQGGHGREAALRDLTWSRTTCPRFGNQPSEEIALTLQQEYDPDYLCQIYEEKEEGDGRRTFRGSGKSFVRAHAKARPQGAVRVPTNKLASNYKDNGVTVDKFFGVGLTDESRLARFDASGYDTSVMFLTGNLFTATSRTLPRVKKYCARAPGADHYRQCGRHRPGWSAIDLISNPKRPTGSVQQLLQ